MPMTTKLGNLLTYLEWLSPIKPLAPLVKVVGNGFVWHSHLAHPRKEIFTRPTPPPPQKKKKILIFHKKIA